MREEALEETELPSRGGVKKWMREIVSVWHLDCLGDMTMREEAKVSFYSLVYMFVPVFDFSF